MISAITGEGNDISEDFEDLASNMMDVGEGLFEAIGGSSLPVSVHEGENEKSVRAEIPFVSSGSVSLDSDGDEISVSVEKPENVEGESTDIDGVKETIEDLVDFVQDTDYSSLELEMSDGVMQVEMEKEGSEFESEEEEY